MKDQARSSKNVIILGIDPGTRITGYGLIKFQDQTYHSIDYGCIRPPPLLKLSERYLIIFNSVEELINKYQPDVLAIERQFVNMNKSAQTPIKLGMATGAVIIPAKKRGMPVYAYAPCVIKRAVVGNGKASKYQVQRMVQQILRLQRPPEPEDAADALALAICHAQTLSFAVHLKTDHEI